MLCFATLVAVHGGGRRAGLGEPAVPIVHRNERQWSHHDCSQKLRFASPSPEHTDLSTPHTRDTPTPTHRLARTGRHSLESTLNLAKAKQVGRTNIIIEIEAVSVHLWQTVAGLRWAFGPREGKPLPSLHIGSST